MTVLERLQAELNISKTDVKNPMLENCVWQAEESVKNRRRSNIVEKQYEHLVYQIALRLWNIRGIEGQTSHSENNISRNFNTDGVISDLLRQIIPFAVAGSIDDA
jgi:hypothetical protein